jgi:hypothetical protein
MRSLIKTILFTGLILGVFTGASYKSNEALTNYKCMVQTVNYEGEGAYIIASLMNPEGKYEKTLYILGEDPEWYHLIDEWWSYFGKEKRDVDGITGATLSGGERQVIAFDIDNSKVDKGYKIRFETSVEDQKYYSADLEIPLTSKIPSKPHKGQGFIRYVRIMTN